MRRYIRQLVDHYRAATQARLDKQSTAWRTGELPDLPPKENDDSFAQHFADVEAYLEGPRPGIDQPLAHYADIDLAELPPAESLTHEEARELFETLNALIGTYGHSVALFLADDAPADLHYGYLLRMLAKPTRILGGGHWTYDCECYSAGCEFGRYCCGLKEWYEEEFVAQGGDATIEDSRFGAKEALLAKQADEQRRFEQWRADSGSASVD